MIGILIMGVFAAITLSVSKQKNLWLVYLLVSAGLALVAYHFDPQEGFDLNSYFNELKIMQGISWQEALERQHWKAYPVAKFYLYNIAQTRNVHLLPALTVFIVCTLFCNTLRKCAKRFDITKKAEVAAFLYFLCCFNFFYLASNIRNLLAASIFLYFLYIDLVEKRFRPLCFGAYIATFFIHSSMLIFIALRIIVFIKNKKIMYASLIACLFYTLFQEQIFTFLQENFDYEFVHSLIERANENLDTSYKAVFDSPRCIMTMLAEIFILLLSYKNMEKTKQMVRFYRYTLCLCVFALCSLSDYWLLMRLTLCTILFFPIVLATNGNVLAKKGPLINYSFYLTYMINFVYLLIAQYSYF